MRYYLDLIALAFWIGIFIHSLMYPDSSVVTALTPWAFICCIIHGVGKMVDHDIDNYMQRLSQQVHDDEKEDE